MKYLYLPFFSFQMTGNFSPSFVSNNIANEVADAEYEQLLLWAARDLYGGGADTVCSLWNALSRRI